MRIGRDKDPEEYKRMKGVVRIKVRETKEKWSAKMEELLLFIEEYHAVSGPCGTVSTRKDGGKL